MCVVLLLAAAIAQEDPSRIELDRGGPVGSGTYARAAVAADHPAAAAAGAEALRAGGNAVDAAVATSLALSVVRPYSCGMGGGGFLLFYDADGGEDGAGECRALDYREVAPAAATRDMFVDDPASSQRGGNAVAVPGTVAGLCQAQAEWGVLDRATVFAPAIRLARAGVPLDEHDRTQQARFLKEFIADPALQTRFARFWRDYLFAGVSARGGGGDPLPATRSAGEDRRGGAVGVLRRSERGTLVRAVRDSGGVLTEADLRDYRPRRTTPLVGSLDGLTLYVMPPPSSGGVALLETLNLLSARERMAGRLPIGSPVGRHRFCGGVEARLRRSRRVPRRPVRRGPGRHAAPDDPADLPEIRRNAGRDDRPDRAPSRPPTTAASPPSVTAERATCR